VNVQDGRVLYNGRAPTRSPLDQVKRGAHSLEGRLRDGCGCDARVTPIVCFAANSLEGGLQGVAGVMLCNARDLNRSIQEPADRPLPEDTCGKLCAFLETIAR
jgi:hypothetical protein